MMNSSVIQTSLSFTNTTSGISGRSQNNGTNVPAYYVGDIAGAASIAFTATLSSTAPWALVCMTLIGPSVIPSPTYSNNIPWAALCGGAGTTQYSPVLITVPASGTFDPTLYGWANYFDVLASSAGGGGNGGGGIFGGFGGAAGAWNPGPTLTKAQAGTTPWTITVGVGGTSGNPGSAGGAGGTTTVAIPGQPTITVTGGAGGSGTGGQPLANPGATLADKVYNDHYGTPHTYPGGAGGSAGQAPGGQPGGGGGGGNSTNINGFNTHGGVGGNGITYVYVYQ